MACSACQKRRKEWQAKQKALQQKKRRAEAAAIGAALAVTEAVGTAIGINGEVEDGEDCRDCLCGGVLDLDLYGLAASVSYMGCDSRRCGRICLCRGASRYGRLGLLAPASLRFRYALQTMRPAQEGMEGPPGGQEGQGQDGTGCGHRRGAGCYGSGRSCNRNQRRE